MYRKKNVCNESAICSDCFVRFIRLICDLRYRPFFVVLKDKQSLYIIIDTYIRIKAVAQPFHKAVICQWLMYISEAYKNHFTQRKELIHRRFLLLQILPLLMQLLAQRNKKGKREIIREWPRIISVPKHRRQQRSHNPGERDQYRRVIKAINIIANPLTK